MTDIGIPHLTQLLKDEKYLPEPKLSNFKITRKSGEKTKTWAKRGNIYVRLPGKLAEKFNKFTLDNGVSRNEAICQMVGHCLRDKK